MSSRSTSKVQFDITNFQTITFPLSKTIFKTNKDRRYFVSATDGEVTKEIALTQIDGSLQLGSNLTLNGFILRPSSQFILQVMERRRFRSVECLATFVISYEALCSSQNTFVLENDNCKKPSGKRTISFSVLRFAEPEAVPVPVSSKIPQTTNPAQQEQRKDLSADEGPHNTDCDPQPVSSLPIDRKPEASRRLQNAKQDLGKIKTARSLIFDIADAADSINKADETTERVITTAQAFLEKCAVIGDKIGFVVSAVDAIAEIHPYAKLAWSVISIIPKKISSQIQLDQDIMDLLDEMEHALHLAPDAETLDVAKIRTCCEKSEKRRQTIKQLMDLIIECGYFIQSYAKDINFWQRLIKNIPGNKTDAISTFRQQLKKLHDAFIDETIVNIDINVLQVLQHVESIGERLEDHDLDTKFPLVPGTRFNPGKGCLDRTRIKFLEAIMDWVNDVDPSAPKVLMLFGQAGTGKSSIAHEIAKRFDDTGRLTTSYCFIRDVTSRDPYKFFTTLARNLCSRYPAFKAALGTVLRKKPDLLAATDYATLFKSFIVDPLEGLQFVSPVLIVIDALDESEDAKRTDPDAFHAFLGNHVAQLPAIFRILMTSRPEPDIADAFPSSSLVRRVWMNDLRLADAVDHDIYIYTQTKLGGAGIDDDILRQLARKAEGLFQWAYVACNYIFKPPRGLNRQICIRRVLFPTRKETLGALDTLYTTVLERFDMDDPYIGNNFRSVMGQVLGVFEPLSITALNMLRRCCSEECGRTDISEIVGDLGSLLSNVTPESEYPVLPLHTSFRDFLTDYTRSGKFCLNLDASRGELAGATVQTMNELLHFNMCGLETSYRLNREVPDLDERIAKSILPALSYSCRFWSNHLGYASKSEVELFRSLQAFMKQKFLFWLEVLSVRKNVSIASKALSDLSTWLGRTRDKVQVEDIDELDALVKDAVSFVRYFGYPIAESAPHIYLSALPFAPSSSVTAELYLPSFPRTVRVERGRLERWPALEMTISVPRYNYSDLPIIVCIALSSDDQHIAACIRFEKVFIWNASTGSVVSSIEGEKVSAIAFSPDGLWLASGSVDGRICIWEAMTGKEVVRHDKSRTLAEQKDMILALSFSQDGRQLVSGSMDGIVLVWDVERREVVAGPFGGHKNPVWAVSFTEDQEHIISRSGSHMIQAWNVQTRRKVMEPFESKDMNIPTGKIHTMALEPVTEDSGFFVHPFIDTTDCFTPCSWMDATEDEEKEKWIDRCMRVCTFSSDGRFIATCSRTHIHIWYANGERAGGPFSNVNATCLAFSADGKRIVSGSEDGAVRMWNIGILSGAESESAKDSYPYSVKITDGEHVVVCRPGQWLVQMLDISTGQEVRRMKRDREYPVAFSQTGDIGWESVEELAHSLHISTRTGDPVAVEGLFWQNHDSISVASFSPTSNDLIAFGTYDGFVYLGNVRTGALIGGPEQICHEKSQVTSLALFSSKADTEMTTWTLVGVGCDHEWAIWDPHAAIVRRSFSHDGVTIGAFVVSADGRDIITAADDYSLCIWDSADGKVIKGPMSWSGEQSTHLKLNPCPHIAFSTNGQKVAFVGKYETVLVFDVVYTKDRDISFQFLLVLAGHVDFVQDMAFSRNGWLLATTAPDRTVRLWDIQAAATRKQAVINSASDDSQIAIWDEAFIDNNGWLTFISGASPLRMIWIPELHRKLLLRPSNVWVVDQESIETLLDLGKYVHGRDWSKCYDGHDGHSC